MTPTGDSGKPGSPAFLYGRFYTRKADRRGHRVVSPSSRWLSLTCSAV